MSQPKAAYANPDLLLPLGFAAGVVLLGVFAGTAVTGGFAVVGGVALGLWFAFGRRRG
ncbi:hypothetical protein LG634_01460 [Streptomyces bambusae]|uniref:hypothetical protein n=1 Tax=Streptomyces bambusae TaxID=1550616 RepID=UPI001CFDB264|nr:hypothetical protein [Streptomyces bambusae]MCB5163517.1 hypothetical protein [Streptomyces bambusae]